MPRSLHCISRFTSALREEIYLVENVCRMEDLVQAWLLRITDLEVRQLL
jgi:hypothetical protein